MGSSDSPASPDDDRDDWWAIGAAIPARRNEFAVSDLGENPTLRDAIADGVSAYRGSYGVGNERLYEHIEDSVRAWLAARELVVPSPQPAPEKATGHYSTLTPSQRRKKLLDEYDEVGRG